MAYGRIMFKKILCLLLIIQHINVFVLHATPGDVEVIFESLEDVRPSRAPLTPKQDSSLPTRVSLKVLKSGNRVFKGIFDRESSSRLKLKPHSYFDGSKDVAVGLSSDLKTVHIHSQVEGQKFSLHLNVEGRALLQGIDFSRHLSIKTFGNVLTGKQAIKAGKLTLNGQGITFYSPLTADELSLTGPRGIKNTPEGRIHIRRRADIWRGDFSNEGRIFGSNRSCLDLHGNDFTNDFIQQKTSPAFHTFITWDGAFRIINVGRFFNVFPIGPQGTLSKAESLTIDAWIFHNKNQVYATRKLSVSCVHHTNDDQGTLESDQVDLRIKGLMRNRGFVSSRIFSLATEKLENSRVIDILEEGYILERGHRPSIVNAPSGQITSHGTLKFIGKGLLHNQEARASRGLIDAPHLTMMMRRVKNDGDVVARKTASLTFKEYLNSNTGVWYLPEFGEMSSDHFANQQSIYSKAFHVTARIFENFQKIFSLEDVRLMVKELFFNARDAFIWAHEGMLLQGPCEVQNLGRLESQDSIDFASRKTTNLGQMVAQEHIHIRTQKSPSSPRTETPTDFDNRGLIISPKIRVQIHAGSNTGATNEAIDRSRITQLEGLLASTSLLLTITHQFANLGHMVGGRLLKLMGAGIFDNAEGGTLNKTDIIESHLEGFTNRGVVRALEAMAFDQLSRGLDNHGLMLSEGSVTLKSPARLSNLGIMEGRKGAVSLTAHELENHGLLNALGGKLAVTTDQGTNHHLIYGQEGVDITTQGLFTNIRKSPTEFGRIETPKTLTVQGQGTAVNEGVFTSQEDITVGTKGLQNTSEGVVVAEKTLTVKTESFDNAGAVQGQKSADVTTTQLSNTGEITSPEGFVSLTVSTGLNSAKGVIAGKTALTMRTEKSFSNDGLMGSEDTCLLTGQGTFTNNNLLKGEGRLTVDLHTLANPGKIVAKEAQLQGQHLENKQKGLILTSGPLDILGTAQVDNAEGAAIISQSSLSAGEKTRVSNRGLISGDTLTFKQPSLENEGRMEARGDVSLPGAYILQNKGKASVVSQEGTVALPQIQVLENEGSVLSQKTLSFLTLSSFQNSGSFQSNEALHLASSGDLSSQGKLVGQSRVSLKGKKVAVADTLSEGNLKIQGEHVEGSRLMRGKKDVTLVGSQTLTLHPASKVESVEGTVKLEAPTLSLAGTLTGKTVDIKQTGTNPLSLQNVTITPLERLALDTRGGWDLQGQAQTIGHSVHLTGPILNPGNLTIKGDFTWDVPSGFQTNFNLFVEGVLTLNFQGPWTNFGNVQGQKGTHVQATKFLNHGTFYSYGKTVFDCPYGFDNYAQMEVWGECDVQTNQGSITNHPDAQFCQKNIAGSQNLVTFHAGQDVENVNGRLLIQGRIDSSSSRFSNRMADPIMTALPDTAEERVKVFAEDSSYPHDGNHWRPWYTNEGRKWYCEKHIPARRGRRGEVPSKPQGAVFSAGEAIITASVGENVGSAITTKDGFTFKGNAFRNRTRVFMESGLKQWTKYRRVGRRHHAWEKSTESQAYSETIDSTPNSFLATIYSNGINDIANFHNDGGDTKDTAGNYSGSIFENLAVRPELKLSKSVPHFTPVADYFSSSELEGPSFWKADSEKTTEFAIIPNKPIHFRSSEEITSQLHPGSKPSQELQAFVKGLEEKLTQAFGKKTELDVQATHPGFWEPKPEDLSTFEKTLAPSLLVQVPPRIALIKDSSLTGKERMHHHPTLLAELVTKTFLDTIGFASISQKITTPELFSRVLEEEGYVNARKLHKKEVVDAPKNWETLLPKDQIANQQREFITQDETEKFQDPAIIYRVWEDFGERVLSALVIFPEAVRKAFKAVSGRILSTYLSIETKEVKNTEGTITGTKALYIKTEGDTSNVEGTLGSEGLTVVQARGNLSNLSGTIEGKEDVLAEGQNVVSQTLMTREGISGGYQDRPHLEARFLSHQGNLYVRGLDLLYGRATRYSAGKRTTLSGGKSGVVLEALPLESEVNFSGDDYSYHRHTLSHQRSKVIGETDATITSDGDLIVRGMDLTAGEQTSFSIEGDFYDRDVHDSVEESSSQHHKKKGLCGSKKSTTSSQSSSSSARGNTYSQKRFSGKVKGDARLQSASISVTEPDKSSLEARRISLEGGRSSSGFSSQRQKKSAFTRSARDEGSTATTHSMTSLTPGMKLKPTEGMEVTINGTLDQLEQNPATAWIRDVRKIPSVRWHLVHDEYDEWRHKSRALTPGCMAIIALATSIATAGIGASVSSSAFLVEALGKTAAHTLGIMAQAGMTTLATNASTSLINNRGHLGKTLKEMSSSTQLRGLAVSIAAAGVTGGLTSELGVSQGKAFTDLLQRSAVQTGVSTALRMATQSLDLREGVIQGIANIVADTVAAYGAQYIGKLYHPLDPKKPSSIGWVEHKLLHAGLGAIVGGASNLHRPFEGAKAGVMAALAETVAELTGPSFEALKEKRLSGTLTREDIDRYNTHMLYAADIGRMAAALTSFALRQDVNAASLTATIAVENNFLQAVIPVVTGGLALWTAYDVYSVYQDEGPEAALQELAILGAIQVVSAGAGKVAYKVGGKLYPHARAGWHAAVAENPTLYKVVENISSQVAKGAQFYSRAISRLQQALNLEGLGTSQVTRAAERARVSQVSLNYQAGRGFQTSVHEHLRIPENNTVYSILLRGKGTLTTRPDLPLPLAGVTDVKNVQYITFTKQLQTQAALAKREGTSFNLVISPNTQRISKQLKEAVYGANGKIFEFNPATETWIECIIDGNMVLR